MLFAEAMVTPRQRMTRALVQRTQSAGQSAFSTLVDTTKPLPHVGHLAMVFIVGTTLVTVLVNPVRDAQGVFLRAEVASFAAGLVFDQAWLAREANRRLARVGGARRAGGGAAAA